MGGDRQVTSRGRWAVGSASDAYIVVSGELGLWKSDDVLASQAWGGGGTVTKVKDHDRTPLYCPKPLTACLGPGRDLFLRGSRFLKQYLDLVMD